MNKCQLEAIKHLLSTMNLKVAEIDKLERLAFQDTPALIDEIERLQHFERKAIYTIEENKRLREALKFYADDKNYKDFETFITIGDTSCYFETNNIEIDNGSIAEKALEEK